MNVKQTLAGVGATVIAAGVLVAGVGATATAAGAASPSTAPSARHHPKLDCSKESQILKALDVRKAGVQHRIDVLNAARQKAVAAHRTDLVVRIDRRLLDAHDRSNRLVEQSANVRVKCGTPSS